MGLGFLDGRPRLERQPHPSTLGADGRQRLGDLAARLEVHRDAIGTGRAELGHQPRGLLDHEMNVHLGAGKVAHRAHHDRPKGEVGHEVVVHHVAVHPVTRGVDQRQLG